METTVAAIRTTGNSQPESVGCQSERMTARANHKAARNLQKQS